MMPIQVHNKKLKPRDDINHNNNNVKKSRFLITVNVLGSAGPIRFLVNGNDLVASVIDTALKTFAREGRLPVLGFDVDKFLLYCANEGSDGIVTNLFFLINFFFPFFCIESIRANRILWGKKLSPVQETFAITDDGRQGKNGG
ncbi:hypothetical protein KPL71_018993 [Citrus sinensis]|uniref:Uncharacterized protein n=1 Tax=Citrus sinensis TaxID=2711 RepID=A0ACB8K1P2_CITSI|nr:hypothetical protein KPL71_018993 [Citrus sinensis]